MTSPPSAIVVVDTAISEMKRKNNNVLIILYVHLYHLLSFVLLTSHSNIVIFVQCRLDRPAFIRGLAIYDDIFDYL